MLESEAGRHLETRERDLTLKVTNVLELTFDPGFKMRSLLYTSVFFLHYLEGALTLGAGGAFPALLTDAGERLPRHHTGPPVFTRVWKTTGVFG